MISTADSLLIVAGQIVAVDLLKLKVRSATPKKVLSQAKLAMGGIAIISFIMFTIFKLLDFNVVQLVFAIFGAQLAMFPSVCAALFLRNHLSLHKARMASCASILLGFASGWTSAIYGKLSGQPNWLYNAPVAALGIAFITFVILAISARTKKPTR